MYRFLISRKTLLLLASIWLASATLLFIAGWLLGRHQASPTVDASRLAELLDALPPASSAPSEPSSSTRRRNPEPWKNLPSAPPPSSSGSTQPAAQPAASAAPPAASAAPTPAAGASTGSTTQQPSGSAQPQPSATSPSTPAGSTPADPPPTASPSPDSPSTASPSPASPSTASPSPASSTAGPSTVGLSTPPSPVAPSAGESAAFSLQIGAFASEQNAQAQIEEVSGDGLDPYIVPVIDGDRTLYTVRIGSYANRTLALQAAEKLRGNKGLAAVIRGLNPG